mgnify:CR=1 FL=1
MVKSVLRPGFAVDLSDCKPYGPKAGEYWNRNQPIDAKELQEMVDYEELFLPTGSPPCDPFSQLIKISAHRRDPAKVEQLRESGVQNLHIA